MSNACALSVRRRGACHQNCSGSDLCHLDKQPPVGGQVNWIPKELFRTYIPEPVTVRCYAHSTVMALLHEIPFPRVKVYEPQQMMAGALAVEFHELQAPSCRLLCLKVRGLTLAMCLLTAQVLRTLKLWGIY